MKKIKFLSLLLALSTFAFAQTPYNMQWGSYSQNFNSLSNSTSNTNTNYPSGWSVFEYGTSTSANQAYRGSTGSSTAGDAYSYGSINSTERSFGSQASGSNNVSIGFGFTNNTGYVLTSLDIMATMEQWREGSGTGLDSSYFSYSTTATGIDDTAASWTSMASLDLFSASNTMSIGALDGNLALNQNAISGTITVSIPANGTIYFKWIDLNSAGSDDGLSVDDLSITLYDANGPLPAGPPTLVATTPADNAINVPLSTTSLSFTISDSILLLGVDSLYLVNATNQTTQSYHTTNTNLSISSPSTMNINNVTLLSNCDYYVLVDSLVLNTSSGFFPGIKDSVTWNFKTENTTPPIAVTMLNETFTGCADPVFGVFQTHSAVGNQKWRCTFFGHGDSNAVHMNGYAQGAKDNEDWLVSPPLDFSTMVKPHLNFWSKLRFPENNSKELLISTNYSGLGDPTLATWNPIQVSNWSGLDTNWKKFTNVDLTQYKTSNFHIAFRYMSDTTAADDWYLDDIEVIEGPQAVSTFASEDLDIKVLGNVSQTLNVQTLSNKNRNLIFAILDMTGRTISTGSLNVLGGKQQHSFNVSHLNSGIYFLHLNNEQAKKTVKFMLR